jgi:hypothetical protein
MSSNSLTTLSYAARRELIDRASPLYRAHEVRNELLMSLSWEKCLNAGLIGRGMAERKEPQKEKDQNPEQIGATKAR